MLGDRAGLKEKIQVDGKDDVVQQCGGRGRTERVERSGPDRNSVNGQCSWSPKDAINPSLKGMAMLQ